MLHYSFIISDITEKLETPLTLSSYLQFSPELKNELVNTFTHSLIMFFSYYHLDQKFLLEIAGKPINSHLKKDEEGLSIPEQRRRNMQINNLRRVSKYLESSQQIRSGFIEVPSISPDGTIELNEEPIKEQKSQVKNKISKAAKIISICTYFFSLLFSIYLYKFSFSSITSVIL